MTTIANRFRVPLPDLPASFSLWPYSGGWQPAVIAVRQALYCRSTWRAVGVCLIGWIIRAPMIVLVPSIAGIPSLNPQAG